MTAPAAVLPEALLLSESALRHPESAKWQMYPPEVLPLWVADMDFAVAPAILEALQARLTRGLGYAPFEVEQTRLASLLRQKLSAQGLNDLPTGGLRTLPGVVPGLYAAVAALSSPGDEVLTMTPVYPPFLSAIRDQGRVLKAADLVQDESGWQIDWDALEAAVSPATRLLMLCHPHNPTGRVWTRAELERLGEFALRHRLWVVSDELHADLSFGGPHVAFASVHPGLPERTVTLTGPCKAYNTAGLGIGAAVSHHLALLDRMTLLTRGLQGHASALSTTMWVAALESGADWLAQVLAQLRANRDHLSARLRRELPWARFSPPEATYLAFLDFRQHPRCADIQQFLIAEAKVGLNDGPPFGDGYQGFVRLNFATSPAILDEAVDRIVRAVERRE
ncbi:MalY/PatB family protein [Deinococcus sp.]|uniref:MalY/PatB family protein n=1 Tax=Deinococcus sp. TaxID=47478 RepID=UPI003CC6299C